ncbi:hypothetical protein ABEW32_14280 [Paenibacillus jamilae]|uniref:hypothetical protein n=1 Tax=Paenibacillus jamilae TaxID=114136 RepID=UPI003D280C97
MANKFNLIGAEGMPAWQLKHIKGEMFASEVTPMNVDESKNLHRLGWEQGFHWERYLEEEGESSAYKLSIIGDRSLQGAIAYRVAEDHVYIDLLESSPHNRFNNPERQFINVTDVLLGAACLKSFEAGKDGFVAFTPKTRLYSYYADRFNAKKLGSRMYLNDIDAYRLIGLYYK